MGKTSGEQTVTQKTQLPKWYDSAAQNAISSANTAANDLAMPYMGNTVAGLDPLQQRAIGLTGQNIGATNGAFNQAIGTTSEAQGYRPDSFLTGDVNAYMNPYIQNVEQAALNNMQQGFAGTLNQIGDRAINAGAFGGSRQGVAEGAAAAEAARQYGDFSAQLRAQGYQNAQGMMTNDMNRNLQGEQLNLQAAGMQGDLAQTGQAAYLQSLQSALAAGQINQQQAQALLAQSQSQYDAMRNYPLEQLNIRLAALGGTQVPTSSTTTTPTTGSTAGSVLGGALSGLSTGASLFGAGGALAGAGGITGGMGAAGGALLGGLAMLSDERSKTNIEPLGVDAITGLPIYAYDYKNDVARAQATGAPMPPKRVGPMAQDIEQVTPGAVGQINGMKVVRNFGFGG